MDYFLYTEAGYNHNNEDAVAVRAHPSNEFVHLCALADGQGGQFGGGLAAKVAVESCLELASAYPVKQLLNSSAWYEILSGADEAVSDEPSAGYTTLIGLCVAGDRLCGVSCGDSAVLLVHNGQHSLLTEKQHKNPPIGSAGAFPVAFSAKMKSEAQVLVMSDGVWKYVGWDAIIQTCAQQQGQQLILALR